MYSGIKPQQVGHFIYCKMHIIVYKMAGGRGDWSNEGCSNATMNDKVRNQDVVICQCNHLSTFGIFVVSLENIICIYSNE